MRRDDGRLRVAHVVTRLNVGGPARVLAAVGARLAEAGVDQVVIHGRQAPREGRLQLGGLPAVEVPSLSRAPHPLRDPHALGAVWRALRRFRPHVVHTRMAKAGTLGRLAARAAGGPAVVHTFHGHVLDGYFARPVERAFLAAERWLARRTDALVAISPQVRDDLLALGVGPPAAWHVIPNGYELAALAAAHLTQAAARARLGVGGDGPVVGTVGRLVPIKDHDTFLAAAAEVARAEPGATFLVAGDGPERERLARCAAPLGHRVRFLGWVDDLPALYRALDLVVLTSRNEGTPAALIEAAAAGVPAVATAVGGVPEVVVHGTTGLVVPPGDPHAVAAGVLRLLRDPGARARMGEAARRHVLARFDADACAAAHLALYEELRRRLAPGRA